MEKRKFLWQIAGIEENLSNFATGFFEIDVG